LAFFAAELESQSIDLDASLVDESVPASLPVDMDVTDGPLDAGTFMDAPLSTTDPTPSLADTDLFSSRDIFDWPPAQLP